MKRILFVLATLYLFSCTKEKEPATLTGTWTLTEIKSGTESSVYLYGTELSIQFKEKNSMFILGPKPNYTFLQDFDRYQVVSGDRIRFYNSSTQDELYANYSVGTTLSLSYEVRCPYEEKFIRR